MTEIVTVPVIIGACYLVGFVIKLFKNEKLDNFIPGICVILGIFVNAIVEILSM